MWSQIFCILLMFLAAVIFGGIIGELQARFCWAICVEHVVELVPVHFFNTSDFDLCMDEFGKNDDSASA